MLRQTLVAVIKSTQRVRAGQLPPFTCNTWVHKEAVYYDCYAHLSGCKTICLLQVLPCCRAEVRGHCSKRPHLTASVSDDQVASFLQLDGEQEGPCSDLGRLRCTVALITGLVLQLHVNTHDKLLLLGAPWPFVSWQWSCCPFDQPLKPFSKHTTHLTPPTNNWEIHFLPGPDCFSSCRHSDNRTSKVLH